MSKWPVKTFGEICLSVDRQDPAFSGRSEFTYIDLSAVSQTTKQVEDSRVIPVGEAPGRARQLVQSGDVLVSTVRPNLNAVALIGDDLDGATASTGFCVLRPNRSIVEPGLLFAWVRNQAFIDELTTRAKGASYPAVTDNIVKALALPVPPLAEQKRIVELLDAATARVTELTACYEQARTHANNLFTSALREALESNPEWPVKTLGEVAIVNPSEPALSEDAPFVPMDAVTAGIRDVQYTQPRGTRSGARARAGDILFARITPCLQNGKVALVQDDIPRCGGSTEFIVVRSGPDVLNGYLYQWITSDHIRDEMTALMKGATGRQRLNAEDLAMAQLPVPPLNEQKRIVARLDSMKAKTSEMVAAYDAKLTAAKNLRQSILEAAFEGAL